MSEVKNKFNELSDEVLDDVAGGARANGTTGYGSSSSMNQASTGYKGLTSTGYKGTTSTGYKGTTSAGYKGTTSAGYKGQGIKGLMGHQGNSGKGKNIKDKNDGSSKKLK